jgi:carbamate kinase
VRPLTVVAVGGNALSPPRGSQALSAEREVVSRTTAELGALARAGGRLLVVHGNGPQVGRLLAAPGLGDPRSLDVHVAQTQGELGYLMAQGLDEVLGEGQTAAIVTRVIVGESDPAFLEPSKPVGPVLPGRPDDAARPALGGGWRRVVASPRPVEIVEREAIAALLERFHVIAGGGGGIPLVGRAATRRPVAAVVDKDWVAALLAIALGAQRLIFVTDVVSVFDQYGGAEARRIATMTALDARARLRAGVFGPGSMAPKVESATEFVEATGRPAVITTPGAIEAALGGNAGTTIAACPAASRR